MCKTLSKLRAVKSLERLSSLSMAAGTSELCRGFEGRGIIMTIRLLLLAFILPILSHAEDYDRQKTEELYAYINIRVWKKYCLCTPKFIVKKTIWVSY